jgi:Tfp pilus assembly protein PilF
MKSKLLLAGVAVALATASGVAYCKTGSDPQIDARSMQITKTAEGMLEGQKAMDAISQFETALAVDPKNVRAYVGMARAYRAIGLPGQSVRFYREALSIDPNDLTALEEQGEALMARGATAKAKENLERIRTLCQSECSEAKDLASVIAKGPPAVQTASTAKPAETPKPNN